MHILTPEAPLEAGSATWMDKSHIYIYIYIYSKDDMLSPLNSNLLGGERKKTRLFNSACVPNLCKQERVSTDCANIYIYIHIYLVHTFSA
jgi:hypothetical protein